MNTPQTDQTMCRITLQDMLQIRTAAGAWTRKQLTELGAWPPKKGWLKRFKAGVMIPASNWARAKEDTGKICSLKDRIQHAQPLLNLE